MGPERKRRKTCGNAEEQPESSCAGGQRGVGGRKQTSNADGMSGSEAYEVEGRKSTEGEGAGPAGRPLPASTIGVRCARAIKRLFGRVEYLARTFGKGAFEEDIRARAAARAAAKAADQPVEEDRPTSGVGTQQDAATGEVQPQPHAAGQPRPKKPGSYLNEMHAVMIIGQPNGKLKTIMTDNMAAHPVCSHQVEMLEAAMQCIMLQDQITASNHARPAAYLEQMGGSGAERKIM